MKPDFERLFYVVIEDVVGKPFFGKQVPERALRSKFLRSGMVWPAERMPRTRAVGGKELKAMMVRRSKLADFRALVAKARGWRVMWIQRVMPRVTRDADGNVVSREERVSFRRAAEIEKYLQPDVDELGVEQAIPAEFGIWQYAVRHSVPLVWRRADGDVL